VRGRRLPRYPTSVDQCDVRVVACSPDQGRGAVSTSSLSLLTILTSRRHLGAWLVKPWPIEGSATVPARIASPRIAFVGRLHGHWPLLSYLVVCGRCWTALVLVAAGVLETPSSTVCRWVHPSRMVHTEGQRHIHRAPVNISYLRYKSDKSLVKKLQYSNSNTNKPRYSFTLGAGRPSLKECIRSSLRTKLLSARLNNSFINRWISDFSKQSRCILVGSWILACSYTE